MTKTIVLVHGAWLTPLAWEFFKARYEARGYRVIAPAWPFEDVPIAELRRAPDARLKSLTVGQIVDHFDRIIRALPESPILIGHSYGGLIVQKLLDRGLGVSGAALDPVPIRGVLPGPRTLASAAPVFIAPFGWSRVLTMSFKTFATTFAQTLPESTKRAAYDRYLVPTPGRLFYQGAFGIGTGIKARNPDRPPLLLAVGEKDITITPYIVRATYAIQKKAPSATAFKAFPRRSHFLFAEPGWEEVADTVLEWTETHQQPATGFGEIGRPPLRSVAA